MSYVVGTLHPPSIISSVVSLNNGCNQFVLSRGNELLIFEISDGSVSNPKIFPFFGNISSISSFGENKLAILLENEILLIFQINGFEIECLQRCDFNYKICIQLQNYIISASNSMIVCHTRKRTIQIVVMNFDGSNKPFSFTQYLPFIEIYKIQCFDDSLKFVLLGKNIQGMPQFALLEVNNNRIELIKTINLKDNEAGIQVEKDENEIVPYLLAKSLEKIYVSYEKNILVFDHFKLKEKITYDFDIISMIFTNQNNDDANSKLSDNIAVYDSKNRLFDINNNASLLEIKNVKEIIPLSNDFYFALSDTDDCHLLKKSDKSSILKIYDTYSQLNCVSFLDRSRMILKNGKIRSMVNGSQTVEEIFIDIADGKNIWACSKYLVISTFNSTIFLDINDFSDVSNEEFLKSTRTIEFFESEEGDYIQITPNALLMNGNELITLKSEAYIARIYNNIIVIASFGNLLEIYEILNSDIIKKNEITCEYEISSLAINLSSIAVGYWQNDNIDIYNHSLELINSINIGENNFISSLIFDQSGNLIIGCCGTIYIYNENEPNSKLTPKTNISNSVIHLKHISNRILAVTDTPIFIDNYEYISAPASIDAVDINGKIGFLTNKGISILSIENHHHSHIEDRYVLFNKIYLTAIDETEHCPIVYAVKKESYFNLITTAYPPVPLLIQEIPTCMTWIYLKSCSEYFLIIGCKVENSGKLIAFNSKLERLSDSNLTNEVDAICFVKSKYITVASGTTLKAYILNNDNNFELKCTEPTRVKCASLTSPNSHAVVYADVVASVTIYTILKGQISKIAQDINPKALKFARLESETDILAIGDNSVIYDISIISNDSNTTLKTTGAFNINCEISSVLSSPDLLFITKSGCLQLIKKCDEQLLKIYNAMKDTVHGYGGLTIVDYRKVAKNGQYYDNGNFADGDFLLLYNNLDESSQENISKKVQLTNKQVMDLITQYSQSLVNYRKKYQNLPTF